MRNLLFLACPIGMGLMMWMMMRGGHTNQDQQLTKTHAQQAEFAALRAELDELRQDEPRSTVTTRLGW